MRESFDDCMIFHLLTLFPNNAAEQEKYYLSNMLKKPQRVGVHQFLQRIEQLNAYAMQLPCWYYSLSYNPSMTLLESSQMGTNKQTHYHRFPLSRVSQQVGKSYQVILDSQ